MGVRSAPVGGIGSDRLTDRACKATRPSPSARKLSDGKGLYLAIMPSGAKPWRLKYRHGETDRTYSVGPYPDVSLAEARGERDRARLWLREGKDPVLQRRLERAGEVTKRATTFEAIAREFIRAQEWSPTHRTCESYDVMPYGAPQCGGNAPL